MSIWSSEGNSSATPYHLRDDNEQYSLPIVVQVERGVNYTENDAFKALAIALGEMFFTDAWTESVSKWMMGRIRKVTRRARGSQWDSLQDLENFSGTSNNVQIKIFEPHPVTEIAPSLRKLQVQGLNLESYIKEADAPVGDKTMFIAVNPDLDMTSGKLIAQVGHAIHIAIMESDEKQLNAWRDNGYCLKVSDWATMPDNSFFIQDAGFTEIPAGSMTVKSYLT